MKCFAANAFVASILGTQNLCYLLYPCLSEFLISAKFNLSFKSPGLTDRSWEPMVLRFS